MKRAMIRGKRTDSIRGEVDPREGLPEELALPSAGGPEEASAAFPDEDPEDLEALEAPLEASQDSLFDVASGESSPEEGEETALVPAGDEASSDLVPYDPLQHYLAEIRKYPFLSKEEEERLARAWREQGDLEAVSRLVLSNLRLVVHIAMEYRHTHLPLMDLIQEGNIGLMQAVKRFDPHRGIRLASYAAWWIRAYILRYILRNWRLVRLGTTQAQRKLFYSLNRERERLEAQGIPVEPRLLAHELNVREGDVIEMEQRLAHPEISLNDPRYEEGEETLQDALPSGDAPVDETLAREELRNLVREKVEAFKQTLGPRDRVFLEERLLAEEPRSLADLGRDFGISRERARQIEARLIQRLREYLQREMGSSLSPES